MPYIVSDGKVVWVAEDPKSLPKIEGTNIAFVHSKPTEEQIKILQDNGMEVVIDDE